MSKRRVVVTGLGLITPVGIGVKESWANIINGQSGIGKITKFDCSTFPSQIAGEVKNFDPLAYIPPKDARRMDTFIQFGIAAGIEAFKDSGIEVFESPELAYQAALKKAGEGDRISVFGSFFTVAGVLAYRNAKAH